LAIVIQLGKARVVSSGSFKNQFGTAAWVYYNKETNKLLGSSRLVMPGYLEDQSSYQSKLSGIYSIVATIVKMESFHDLRGGAIKVMCNGKIPYIDALNHG